MKPLFLRLHRWLTLIFSVPLAIVIVTGLILSVEPIATASAIKPGSITETQLTAALARHDPDNKTRMLAFSHGAGSVTLVGGGRRNIDLATGEAVKNSDTTASLFRTSRRLHEELMIEANWLVVASTFAMVALMLLGLLMGWPRLRNTVAGWHKGVAWCLLPPLLLSPLTGLGITYGVSLSGPDPAAARAPGPSTIRAALPLIAKEHDLSNLIWVRKRGDRVIARVLQDGEYRVHAVTNDGTVATARNWSRLLHEGNGFGTTGALLNTLTGLAMVALMGTGLFMWARRKLRRRQPRARAVSTA